LWRCVLLMFALLCIAGTLQAQSPALEDWSIESRQEVFALESGKVLQIDQPFGDIRIEGADVDSVIITLVSQHRRDAVRQAMVRKIEDEKGLSLTIDFTNAETPGLSDRSRDRIDVGVQVPAKTSIVVRTKSGVIELKKLQGAAELNTQSGKIEFDGAGKLEARSQQGSIQALVRSTQTDDPLTLESVSGDVWVKLLEGASATVEMATKGLLITDYTIDIKRQPGSRHKVGRATIGAGRRMIRLKSENGSARLANVIVGEGEKAED